MSTDKTLIYIGTISYKDLHNQEIMSKYDDNTVFNVIDIPENRSDRDIYIDGIEALNTYYPAIKNRYKTFGFTIAEVPVEM